MLWGAMFSGRGPFVCLRFSSLFLCKLCLPRVSLRVFVLSFLSIILFTFRSKKKKKKRIQDKLDFMSVALPALLRKEAFQPANLVQV